MRGAKLTMWKNTKIPPLTPEEYKNQLIEAMKRSLKQASDDPYGQRKFNKMSKQAEIWTEEVVAVAQEKFEELLQEHTAINASDASKWFGFGVLFGMESITKIVGTQIENKQ